MQTKQFKTTSGAVKHVIKTEGILGFYRGFLSTVAREIPFTCIQFPLYEYFKRSYAEHKGRRIEPYEAALWGSLAGGIAAAVTTPLDVCKTRIMLLNKVRKALSFSSSFFLLSWQQIFILLLLFYYNNYYRANCNQ